MNTISGYLEMIPSNVNTNNVTPINIITDPSNINQDIKTGSSDVDYTALFRGLSTFELASFNSTIEAKPESDANQNNKTNGLNFEKTMDLSELLLQDQQRVVEQESQKEKTLTQLIPIDVNLVNNEVKSVKPVIHNTSDLVSSSSDRAPRKRVISARQSVESNSTASSEIVPRSTRGRRPASSLQNNTDDGPTPRKLTKKQQMLLDAKAPVVCFGNKVVEKGTDEYTKRRENNNDAVKRCRLKMNELQKEKEERMKKLSDENKKLSETVESLSKELNVLKGIIIQMNPQKKLPDHIESILKNLDS